MNPDTLKTIRTSLDLSIDGFAAYAGIPVHTLKKWENGTRKPDTASCEYLALLARLPDAAPLLHHERLERVSGVQGRVVPTDAENPASGPICPDPDPMTSEPDDLDPDNPDAGDPDIPVWMRVELA